MNVSLNFGWSFLPGRIESAIESPLKSAQKVMIPHCVDIFPAQYLSEYSYQQEYTYQLIFDCKDASPVKLLRFDGAMLQFDCYLNGQNLGHFISGFFPVEIDVTKYLRPKNNTLVVFLDGREDKTIPPFGKVVDYLTFAGIYREVTLRCLPEAYIQDYFVRGKADGTLNVDIDTVGQAQAAFALYDHGKLLAEFQEKEYHLANVHPWTCKDPYLYDLEIRYGEHVLHVPVGFRDVRFSSEGFFINGKKSKLIGLNRHQTYPYFGPAAPKSLQEEDADLLKASGLNLVRTSHYPQSEHFLRRCDEIGLMVVDEIPGWQYIGKDEKWRENCRDFARRMVLKERNHPCLIAYGLRIDESGDDDELYSSIIAIKNQLDPTRQSLGVRNVKDSHCLEDIYGYNDFSCGGLTHGCDASKDLKTAKGKAILITESNGHVFPTKSFDGTARRLEHAQRHALVLNDVLSDDGYCGAVTWCAFDYNTHREFGSVDHICHHGVYDIFRNPKFAGSFFQSQQSRTPVLEVASLMETGDFDAALMGKIYVFTNADYVELYRADQHVGRFYPARKQYPSLPHPPVIVDDIIGDIFDEPKISKEDGKKIVESFNYCAQYGYGALRLRDKLLLARMMAKYHFDFSYIYATYTKYVQTWGEGSILWRFEAYKDGKKVATVTRGASTDYHLEVRPTRETLTHGETYDCCSIHIFKKDQFGTTTPYASDVVMVETEGPIEVYGPKVFSLYGGGSTIYIRTLPAKGPSEGVVKITCMGETLETRLLIKQA